jgi:hypothetical protein
MIFWDDCVSARTTRDRLKGTIGMRDIPDVSDIPVYRMKS